MASEICLNNVRIGIILFLAFSHLLISSVEARNYTIQGEDGDIIDCVDIYKQPAFKHPLLKDHIVQLRPSSPALTLPKRNENDHLSQSWNKYGNCPDGTIPIARTDHLFNKISSSIHNKTQITDGQLKFKHEYAKAFTQSGGPYYGTVARLNVWNPVITVDGETSLSQIWVQSGYDKDLNSIEAGWMVKHGVNNKPKLFIYWTKDNFGSTGCYNLLCPGFVQVNGKIALGATLTPVSTYKGRQFYIELNIHKDRQSGYWWLRFGNEELGYWPSSLFTSLKESSNTISWGGEVTNSEPNGRHTSSQMGSGHYPSEEFRKAAFIFDIKYVDGNGQLKDPNQLQPIVSYPACYDLKLRQTGLQGFGVHFFYGGPGFTTSGKCL